MFIKLKLRVTSRWLGDQKSQDPVRKFKRTRQNQMEIDETLWLETIRKAARDLKAECVSDAIKLPTGIPAPTFKVFRRKFNKVQYEDFESIDLGSIISIPIVIDEDIWTDFAELDIKIIFRHIGNFYGLSPWGAKFSLGRFVVIDD